MWRIETLIWLTLKYSEHWPGLTREQIWQRLLGNKKIAKASFQEALVRLVDWRVVRIEEIFQSGLTAEQFGQKPQPVYYLAETLSGAEKLRELRGNKNAIWSQERRRQIEKLESWWRNKPWARALAVTGSQVFSNQEGDIDFLLVVAENYLWWARWQLSVWTWWKGKKRLPGQKKDKGWCFNIWLEEGHLGLPPEKQTLFSFFEAQQMIWWWQKPGVEWDFWQANQWLDQFGVNLRKIKLAKSQPKKAAEKLRELRGNKIGEKWQRQWMKHHRGGQEVVSSHQAFFHPFWKKTTKIDRQRELSMEMIGTNWQWGNDGEKLPLLLKKQLTTAREKQQIVVLVTGVFDGLHQAHRDFLQAAKAAGELLIVGIETDQRVRKLKGANRPKFGQWERAWTLAKEVEVDGVLILPEEMNETAMQRAVLQEIQPDLLAVSTSTQHLLKKRELMEEIGGQLVVVKKLDPEVSSSQRFGRQLRSRRSVE